MSFGRRAFSRQRSESIKKSQIAMLLPKKLIKVLFNQVLVFRATGVSPCVATYINKELNYENTEYKDQR